MEEIRYEFNESFLKGKIKFDGGDTVLYRVMSLEQFVAMLLNKKGGKATNTLVRPWMWEDPYEKILKSEKTPFNSDGWFGQCWSLSKESDSIWRSFSQNGCKRCVKIKVSIENLRHSLKLYNNENARFILSPVFYLSENDIERFAGTGKNLARMALVKKELSNTQFDVEATILLCKRKPFESENEVRLLVFDESENAESKTWTYPFDINSYVDEVVFDPWTPEHYQRTYVKLLGRLGFKDARKKVKFSNLYTPITNS